MDDIKINSLVGCIQSHMIDASDGSLMAITRDKCSPEFEELYLALEPYGKRFIAKFIMQNTCLSMMGTDEIWDDFVTKRLFKSIQSFDSSTNAKFTTYIYQSILFECKEELRRKLKKKDREDSLTDDEGEETQIRASGTEPEDKTKLFLRDFLESLCGRLNKLRTDVEKIFVYHCKKILDEGLRYETGDALICEWRKQPLIQVSRNIENAYTTLLESKTTLMKLVDSRLNDVKAENNPFLGDMEPDNPRYRPRINEWIYDIDKRIKNLQTEIIESFS